MDNFLTKLYFELFKLNETEGILMSRTSWEDSENGRIQCCRNDQSISETRKASELIRELIEAYLEKLRNEG